MGSTVLAKRGGDREMGATAGASAGRLDVGGADVLDGVDKEGCVVDNVDEDELGKEAELDLALGGRKRLPGVQSGATGSELGELGREEGGKGGVREVERGADGDGGGEIGGLEAALSDGGDGLVQVFGEIQLRQLFLDLLLRCARDAS